MRLRKVKNAETIISTNSDICITTPELHKGYWHNLFQNDNPIFIEIGMGKGKFIIENASANKDINYIGIEKMDSVICRAIEKVKTKQENLFLVRGDALNLKEYFGDSEVARIYLNFSDPWPKKRQYKRRLTHPSFLEMYKEILAKNGEIWLKTDNQDLFEYSIKSINNFQMEIIDISLDLHATELVYETTEFEDKFVSENKKIYFLKVKFKEE